MKKTKLLSIAAVFAILTAIFCVTTFAQENTLTLYIDQNTTVAAGEQDGSVEKPYSTTAAAQTYAAGQSADTIVFYLLGDYDVVQGGQGHIGIDGKTIKITAASSSTVFQLNTLSIFKPAVPGSGSIVFENITIGKGYGGSDINLNGYNLTFGENVEISDQNLSINQAWSGNIPVNNQVVDIKDTGWKVINVNIANDSGGTITGTSTVKVSGDVTAQSLGLTKSTNFNGTQNYIIGATVRDLYLGAKSAQKGKRYVQVNAGGVMDGYTTGDATGLTVNDFSGVNIIEINGGVFNSTGSGTEGGSNKTEPSNFKKINVNPNNPEAWANVTRVVIFNDNKLTDVAVTDTAAIVLRVAAGGHATAVTTEPTEANGWDCELLGFEIALPTGMEYVYIDSELAEEDANGRYVIDEAGEHTVTFGRKYTVTFGEDSTQYAPGTVITLPAAPAHDNADDYTFQWSDGENTYAAGAQYTVNGDVTFAEVWTAKEYTVIFKNGEETVSEATLAYGVEITAPADPTAPEGQVFDGWYNGETKFVEGTTVTGAVTYVARFCYTVTFGEATTNYAPGAVITLPAAPAHDNAEHYTFKWSDGTTTYDAGAEYTVNASVTFTEVWTAKNYTVKFMNGETPVSEESLAYDSVITAPEAPEVAGMSFEGWFNGDVEFVEGTKVTGDVTYVAKFGAVKYAITVVADLAAGGTVTGAGQYEYDAEVTLTATANFGYAFDGWYVGEDKVSDVAEYTITVTEAKEYTAKFVVAAVEIEGSLVLAGEGTYYDVMYDADGNVVTEEGADYVYTYNNAAKITVYDGDEEIVFEGTEEDEFKFDAVLGTYRVEIVKNGYLTFDEEIEIVTGNELSEIVLIPGDIKADYDADCGDGVIDIDDFIRVLRGFSEESSDRLRHAVDIDEDGSVNVTDLAYIKTAMSENE